MLLLPGALKHIQLENNLRILCGSLPSRLSSAEQWEGGTGTSSSMSSGFVLEKSMKTKNLEENDDNNVLGNKKNENNVKLIKKLSQSTESVKSFDTQNNGYKSDSDFNNLIESEIHSKQKLLDFENKKQILQIPSENVLIQEILREIG